MLDMSRKELAERAAVAERTIVDFERGARTPYSRTLNDIRRALEDAGIEFVAENGGGPGIRLRTDSRGDE